MCAHSEMSNHLIQKPWFQILLESVNAEPIPFHNHLETILFWSIYPKLNGFETLCAIFYTNFKYFSFLLILETPLEPIETHWGQCCVSGSACIRPPAGRGRGVGVLIKSFKLVCLWIPLKKSGPYRHEKTAKLPLHREKPKKGSGH